MFLVINLKGRGILDLDWGQYHGFQLKVGWQKGWPGYVTLFLPKQLCVKMLLVINQKEGKKLNLGFILGSV